GLVPAAHRSSPGGVGLVSAEDEAPQQFAPVQLGALERQVMEALWDNSDLTIRDVITALGDVHAYTTIATVMTNLDRKAMVCSRREGRSVHYSPSHSRSEHAARAMEHALSASNDRTASKIGRASCRESRKNQET